MSDTVKTALYIGGQERHTAEQMAIADPAKAGGIVGYAASATVQDVADAVAAAKTAYPAWSALTPQQRAEHMKAAIEGVPDSPNPFASEDGALLSQENGKVRIEGWVDVLVLQIRWNLALMHADEVNASKVLKPVPGPLKSDVDQIMVVFLSPSFSALTLRGACDGAAAAADDDAAFALRMALYSSRDMTEKPACANVVFIDQVTHLS